MDEPSESLPGWCQAGRRRSRTVFPSRLDRKPFGCQLGSAVIGVPWLSRPKCGCTGTTLHGNPPGISLTLFLERRRPSNPSPALSASRSKQHTAE
jgi:hypothetical protein